MPLPRDAQCKSCSYPLIDLPQDACPECSRAFDPADPTTYAVVSLGKRRLVRAIAIMAVLFAIGLVVAPRGVRTGQVVLTCPASGTTITVRRWESVPPSWITLRYPAFRWTTRVEGTVGGAFRSSGLAVKVSADFPAGSASGWTSADPRVLPLINGVLVDETTAAEALAAVMAPDCTGVVIGTDWAPGAKPAEVGPSTRSSSRATTHAPD